MPEHRAPGVRAFGLLGLVLAASVVGAAPRIAKVEPPNWWVGHSLNPVRLLVRGSELEGARVLATSPGLTVGTVRVNTTGSYLFVDLHIGPDARTGAQELVVQGSSGRATLPFALEAPLPRAGRFGGLSSDDVLYLLMPDRFANGDPANDDPDRSKGLLDRSKGRYYHGGDLRGVIAKLPYLKDLGVTALWLNPVYDNSDRLNTKEQYGEGAITDYHGYGAVDFYSVDEHLGTLADFRELTERAHALGLKIVQDQVANHTGPSHPWTLDPPTPSWYHGTPERHLDNPWQTWALADPTATTALQRPTLEGWFVNLLPDLDQGDPEGRRYAIQNALWWVGATGLDAIRQDTLPYVPRDFWRDWSAALRDEYPQLTVVGEMWDDDPALVSFFQGGIARYDGIDSGISTLFDFPLFAALRRTFAGGQSVRGLARVLAQDRLYVDAARLVTFVGLHDVERFMNQKGATPDGLALALTASFTLRGIPMLYYGDEIGLPGGNDPDNRRDFPGGFPGDSRNAFEASGRNATEQALFEHVRRLTKLRRELAPLRLGRTLQLAVEERTWCYARVLGNDVAIVALNNGAEGTTVECPLESAWREAHGWTDRLLGAAALELVDGRLRVGLGARRAAILTPSR